jgi:ferredoxin
VKVWVDPQRCQGHTLCAMIAPEAFELDDIEGHSSAVFDEVPPGLEDKVREAAQSCPECAIFVDADTGSSRSAVEREKPRETTS